MSETATTTINIVGDYTTVNAPHTTDQPQEVPFQGPVSNCSTTFNYYRRDNLDTKLENIQKGKVQILHGALKTGKGCAARQFIGSSPERFAISWHIDCSETDKVIEEKLRKEFAVKLRLTCGADIDELFQSVKEIATKKDVIFLLTSVPQNTKRNWLQKLWKIRSFLYIIMTSNYSNLDLDFPDCEMIPVDTFDEAIEFLKENNVIKEENGDEELEALCNHFSWNVLGIVASKRYMVHTRTTIKQYLKMMAKETAALKVRNVELQDTQVTLYAAVQSCLKNISHERFRVVAAISLIFHEDIPDFLLHDLFRSEDVEDRRSALNELILDSFFQKLLKPISKENEFRLLSCDAFTQRVIADLLAERGKARENLIDILYGILVKYFKKDNRYKKDAFVHEIMMKHAEAFLQKCADSKDERALIMSARLSDVIGFALSQQKNRPVSDSKVYFQHSENILHKLCNISDEDFQTQESNSNVTDRSRLQSLGIDDKDVAIGQRLFKKLSLKSSQLSPTTVKALAFSRPVSAVQMHMFPAQVKERFQDKVASQEPLSDADLEILIKHGAAYPMMTNKQSHGYKLLYLPELYVSVLYSFGRNYFYLPKDTMPDANLYVDRMKLAYCIASEISKKMKHGEAVMHEYLVHSNALLYLLVNADYVKEDGCVQRKETVQHYEDLKSAIRQYKELSESEIKFFEFGILQSSRPADVYLQLVCQDQILRCCVHLMSQSMTSLADADNVDYVQAGSEHCKLVRELLENEHAKTIKLKAKYFNSVGEFYLAAGDDKLLLQAWCAFLRAASDLESEKDVPLRLYLQAVVGLADVLSRMAKPCFIAAQMSSCQLKYCERLLKESPHAQHHFPREQVDEIRKRNAWTSDDYFAKLWRRGENL